MNDGMPDLPSPLRIIQRDADEPRSASALLVPGSPFDPFEALRLLKETGATDVFDHLAPKNDRLERAVLLDGAASLMCLEPDRAEDGSPAFRLTLRSCNGTPPPGEHELARAAALVGRRFALDTDLQAVRVTLEKHPVGAYLVKRCWPMRVPGLADPWSCLLSTIISSRIYTPLARRLEESLARTYGRTLQIGERELAIYPTAEQVAALEPGDLLKLQFSRQKASYLPAIGRAFTMHADVYDWERLRGLPGAEAVQVLDDLHGVGPWIAGYVALRGLMHGDIFLDDPAVRPIVAPEVEHPEKLSAAEIQSSVAHFAPHRSFACLYAYMVHFGRGD